MRMIYKREVEGLGMGDCEATYMLEVFSEGLGKGCTFSVRIPVLQPLNGAEREGMYGRC